MSLRNNPTLRKMAQERVALLRKIAPVLPRAGPNHPYRTRENKRRTQLRRTLRAALRQNEQRIVSHIMVLYQYLNLEE